MPNKTLKTSYNAGELSPYIDIREDMSKYHNGCSVLENGTVLPYGGVVKRSGTKYIATCKGLARQLSFQFSIDDTMIIEMGGNYFRFFKNDVAITITQASVSAWGTGTVYAVNYMVSNGGSFYYCTTAHTGGTFATDLAAGKWKVMVASGTDLIYEIYHPYVEAVLWEVQYVQSADVIFFAQEDNMPQKLSRLADNSWTMTDVPFTGGPFLPENTTSAYLMGFERTGGTARSGYYFPADTTGTLTASGTGNAPFNVNMVGSLFQVNHTRPDNVLSTTDNDANTAPTGTGIKLKGDFSFDTNTFATGETVKLWRKQGNGSWQEYKNFSAATAYSATENDEDVYYAFTRDKSGGSETTVSTLTAKNQINKGIVRITGFTSTTVVSATVVSPVLSNNSSDEAVTTSMWSEGAWSGYRGNPRAITFYEDRLWFGGSTNNPQTICGSKSGDYDNFTAGIVADDAVVFTLNPTSGGDVSNIQWLGARELMFAGTATTEFQISASNIDNPITPTDIKARDKSYLGSALVQPRVLNNALFYVQGQGRKVRALRFTLTTEQYEADDATILNNVIFESSPIEMAVQKIPDSILWIVRADGQLVPFTYEPVEEVMAWARHTFRTSQNTIPSYVKSIAVIRGSIEDNVYLTVQRTIGGSTVYYQEKITTRYFDEIDSAVCLDCASVGANTDTPTTVIYACDTVRYGTGLYGSGLYGAPV